MKIIKIFKKRVCWRRELQKLFDVKSCFDSFVQILYHLDLKCFERLEIK